MNLLFNLEVTQPNITGKRHGGGIYGEIVFRRMLEKGVKMSALYDSTKWINPELKTVCEENNVEMIDLNNQNLSEIVNQHKIDRIYTPLATQYLANLNCEVLCTRHGLRDLETPDDWMMLRYKIRWKDAIKLIIAHVFPKWWRKRKYAKRSYLAKGKLSRFVTVSNHSKFSILAHFPLCDRDKVSVFYSPDTTRYQKLLERKTGNYFLMVSGNRWEKNNLRALMALDSLFSEGRLEGKCAKITGCSANNFKYKFRNPERFEFLGYVEDEELNKLYAECYAFIYPSLNEGFGYPPLEAMRYGKPLAASSFTSIPEVCGNTALYFNPFDMMEIKNRVLMLTEREIYAQMSTASAERFEIIKRKQDKDLDGLIDWILKE